MHRSVEPSIGSAANEDIQYQSLAKVCPWPADDAERRGEYPLPASSGPSPKAGKPTPRPNPSHTTTRWTPTPPAHRATTRRRPKRRLDDRPPNPGHWPKLTDTRPSEPRQRPQQLHPPSSKLGARIKWRRRCCKFQQQPSSTHDACPKKGRAPSKKLGPPPRIVHAPHTKLGARPPHAFRTSVN